MAADRTFDIVDSTCSNIPYQPLDATRKEVRFLQARRRDPDGHIIVNLKHFPLQKEKCPRFTALSYVWGEHRLHQEPVTVDGQTCAVLESIHPILGLLCDYKALQHETWFWIDYLCINQGDPAERATQVALMGSLYRFAFRTIVWLGLPAPALVGAVDTLRRIANCRETHGDTREAHALLRSSITSAQWDAVNRWMDLPWFTRVWTLQEFVIPNRLVFHYGEESITKLKWAKAIGAVYDHRAVGRPEHRAYGNQWARRRLLEYEGDDRRLVALMAYVGYYKATDPRDRIYAMLGICTDVDRLIVGPPNYSKSVEETYISLARQFITIHRSLDIICFSALFNDADSASRSENILPSWAPDWRRWSDRASRPVPSMVSEPSRDFIGNFRPSDWLKDGPSYSASGRAKAEVSFSEDGRALMCQGLVIDIVDGLGPTHHPAPDTDADLGLQLIESSSATNISRRKDTLSAANGSWDRATSDAVLEALVRSLCLDRSGRYLTFEARIDRYIHEFQHGLEAAEGHTPFRAEYDPVIDWFEANQGLQVRGATLKQHFDAATPPPDRPLVPARHTVWTAAETTIGHWPWDCRLIVTEAGCLGMAPRAARRGDLVAVLLGCSVPVILRRADRYGVERYVVVGECFMPGFMSGEALAGQQEFKEIVLE